MKYILTNTARRKNAKRHICGRYNDLESARKMAQNINEKLYVIQIYNGKWELIETVAE